MTGSSKFLSPWIAPLLLVACAVMPNGPSVMALPGTGKSVDQFRSDDFSCRNFAQAQLGGGSAQQASVDSGVRSAALGTALGANAGNYAGYGAQQRYDASYLQCMYANGNKVPVTGQMASGVPFDAAVPPPDTPPPQ
ncbi:MAG TPA: hypothetical protein DCW29_20075 [Janthinobacterium sp.]|nr:hypothetical protein [Janthinobacterium sp.]